ncbi:DUF4259 domain-containing protein [Corynebacterium renale]|uniref:Uncharacterized protein DUF4259 n=1 Tax=Corynebacterium renale TaxID=1724 RepID=A0A2A9DQ39_9CORY|nr:DUF4259 domain-containing protein [Corynebacterium renale]PFG28808.1 uncharacterized protein DUF4259 [Corynebacterium renale]SQI25707.1 Uncharacterised protein [Corynebacterium renale]
MATWNTGPFDNDEAQELLEDLRSGLLDPVELIPNTGYRRIDADEGQIVVALAALATSEEDDLPDGISPDIVAPLREPTVKERLRQNLEAIVADAQVSDLFAWWQTHHPDKVLEWKAASWVSLG